MKNLPLEIRHFALDTLYEIKLWCYAIINRVVPVAPRDDYSKSKDGNWYIEFSAPAVILARRKRFLQAAKAICIYFILPVLAGIAVALIIQNMTTR